MNIPIMYNVKSMWQRRLTTALTICGIALVVFIFAAVLMLANGLEQTLIAAGSDNNVIILRKSASSEVLSSVSRENAGIIEAFAEIAKTKEGQLLVSKDLVSIINLFKAGSSEMGNITVRGVTPEAFALRPQVKMIEGERFREGADQIIVGKSLTRQFQGCKRGDVLKFGAREWRIVGVFEARNSAFESEIWCDVHQMSSALNRNYFSSITISLKDPKDLEKIKAQLQSDLRLQQLEAKAEKKYYEEQSAFMGTFIRTLGMMITTVFSIAAIIGAMVTMYSAVANRTRIIGTLRVLGFRRSNILASFLFEAVLISLCGGVIGMGCASLLQFLTISTLNFGTFTETAFSFKLSTDIVLSSLFFAGFMGIIGGLLPAARAARLPIVKALCS